MASSSSAKLGAPASSSAALAAQLAMQMSDLTLLAHPGGGKEEDLVFEDGRKVTGYEMVVREGTFRRRGDGGPAERALNSDERLDLHLRFTLHVVCSRTPRLPPHSPHSLSSLRSPRAVGILAGLVPPVASEGDSSSSSASPALLGISLGSRLESVATPWLGWKGPKCTDAERVSCKEDVLGVLKELDGVVGSGGGYVGGGDGLGYGDVAVLGPVLWLWRYVLGGDVKGGLGGVGGWVARVVGDARVVKAVNGQGTWWWWRRRTTNDKRRTKTNDDDAALSSFPAWRLFMLLSA